METTGKYQAHLQRGGMGVAEMRRLLEALAEHGDFEELRRQAQQENLLGKTSEETVKATLATFRRRFVQSVDLPPVLVVARVMHAPMPDAAKNHILLPYFVCTDPLVGRCYRELVLARLDSPDAGLETSEVVDYLTALSEGHPEIAKWSEYLRVRWSRGFLALLRQFGLMERQPNTHLRRLWLLPEPFAFFWIWFWEQSGTFWGAERNDLWALLQLDEDGRDQLLAEGQQRGWWRYQRLGDIVQFEPEFSSIEEWLKNGLA